MEASMMDLVGRVAVVTQVRAGLLPRIAGR
jgi:hypothetical protein